MKKTHITVKTTNSNTYPNLYKNLPYSYEINGKDWPDKKENILTNIAGYLVHNPYDLIVFRNKLPEKEVLGETLDTLVEAHNFSLKLCIGRKKMPEKEKAFGITLDTLVKGHNLTLKLGKGMNFSRLRKARKILNEMARE